MGRESIPGEIRLELHRWMLLTRAFDDAMVAMWKQGRGLGGTFSERGHEAISVGVGMALGPDDVVAPMHRDLGTYLIRGMTPERIFGNLLGKTTGPSGGRDANLHGMGDLSLGILGYVSHLPQSLPVALGAAMAFRYRRQPRVALTFVGDGGSCSGGFHETLNMAALYQAPFVLVVENNQYAYSTPLHQEMRSADIATRARGYGMPATRIDGNDVELVYRTALEAIEHARSGDGPSVIETTTMRMLGHAIHDGAEYVPRELLDAWAARDPIRRHRIALLEDALTTSDRLDLLSGEVQVEVDQAIAAAEAAPYPEANTVEEGVYA